MKILLIDNYDSFTFNLYQYLCESGAEVVVRRNDEITVAQIQNEPPQKIVISPGPCAPEQAGVTLNLIESLGDKIPMLGVCLGHQAIAVAYGARVLPAKPVKHGKVSKISHDGQGVFQNLPNPFAATRYHSLIVADDSLPDELQVTARSEDGVIMGLRHRVHPIEGVQFHPESILSQHGHALLKNFLQA